jgi:fucose 4-O-acetylase-like acetyltransferase
MAANFPVLSTIFFAGAIFSALIGAKTGLTYSLLFGSSSYAVTGPHFIEPGVERILVMAVSLVASISFAGLAMRKCNAFAFLGQRSLSIFVLHAFCVQIIGYFIEYMDLQPVIMFAASAPIALTLAFALASLDHFFVAFFKCLARLVCIPVGQKS